MNDENGHPALFPILGGKQSILSITIKYDVSCGMLVVALYQVQEVHVYFCFFEFFFSPFAMNEYLNYVKCLFCVEYDCMIFLF